MNGCSLSVYVKKWIILNKLNFIYFTWFVYTFVNYKYNVLLKRDDACLIALSTFVTLSRFDEGNKKPEYSVVKWPRNPILNVMATLQQRCGNVLITSESNAVTTSETDVGTTLIFDRATTLWQRQKRRCDIDITTSLCQLGYLSQNRFSVDLIISLASSRTTGKIK